MKGLKTSALCLIASLGTSVQAARPAEIQLVMTQLTGKQCTGELQHNNTVVPGDCITYRFELKNLGEITARYVEVSAMIPEHTELNTTFRKINTQEMLGSVVEQQSDGKLIIKTTLDSLQADAKDAIVLEYSVRVL